jgi:hypothetical protein
MSLIRGSVKGGYMASSGSDSFGVIAGQKGLSIVAGVASVLLLVSLFLSWIVVNISVAGMEFGFTVSGLSSIALTGTVEGLAALLQTADVNSLTLAMALESDPNGETAAMAFQILGYLAAVLSIGVLVAAIRSIRPGSSERSISLASLGAGVIGALFLVCGYLILGGMKDAAGDFGSFFNIGMGFYVAAVATVIFLVVGLRGVMASRS